MKIIVLRNPSSAGATIGKMFIDGIFACHTLEDEVREIPGQPVEAWKIPKATAIPCGTYNVKLENSPHFGPDTLTLVDVPGFQFIRMHAGNDAQDTDGCILLGMMATQRTLVGGTSRPAVTLVKSQVKGALNKGEEVTISINNHEAFA